MISVLTVNYHSAADLRGLYESLLAHNAGLDTELIITNNSVEDRIDLPADGPVAVRVIDSENVGFGAGINRAYRAAKGEYLFLANPDVRVTPGACQCGVETLTAQTDIGLVLPLLRYPDGEIQPSVRRFYTWPVVFWARSPLRAVGRPPWFFREYLYEGISLEEPTDVDWGIGGAMFLRRSDFPLRTGRATRSKSDAETTARGASNPAGQDQAIFDERFFLYFEDVDLCLRLWQAGKRVCFMPELTCIHDHRRASRKPFSRAGWYHFQSLLRFVAKHGGLPRRPEPK